MHDVTVSVWNRFHSFQLIAGLTGAGFSVLALGTTRRKPPASSYVCCWSSAFLTQASYQLPRLQCTLTNAARWRYEKFAASHAAHARCFWGWSNHHLEAFRKAKRCGIPVILEVGSTHALWQQEIVAAEYKYRGLDLFRRYDPQIAERCVDEYQTADRISVPSQFVASTFQQKGVPVEKLVVNPYGVDANFWAEALTSNNAGPRRFVFIYVGQIMLRKGIAYLLEAMRQLDKTKCELWLVGGVDPDSEQLMSSLPPNVKLLGPKSHFEIRDLYKQAHAYVLPSLEEGMARSLLEAVAAGVPPIATRETGITDIIIDGQDGWIVAARNSSSLAVAMQEAIDQPEIARQRGQSAAQRTASYTWEAYGKRAATFLREFIGERL